MPGSAVSASMLQSGDTGAQLGRSVIMVTSDEAGRFVFKDIPAGSWVVHVEDDLPASPTTTVVPVWENALTSVTIRVHVAPIDSRSGSVNSNGPGAAARGGAPAGRRGRQGAALGIGGVRGRVYGRGQRLADATVTLVQGPGPAPDLAALTDAAGGFAFDGIPTGTWVVRAQSPAGDVGEASVVVRAGVRARAEIHID